MFYHDGEGGSALPSVTRVNKNDKVVWNEHPFPDSWFVRMNTPSDYDIESTGKYRWRPLQRKEPIPVNVSVRSHDIIFLHARTPSDDNLGHVLMDTYVPLLSAIDTWVGLKAVHDVALVDTRNGSDTWVPSKRDKYQEIRNEIGKYLFKRVDEYDDFVNRGDGAITCFDQVLVGTGGQEESVLHGGAFLRQRPLLHLKRAILRQFLPKTGGESGVSQSDIQKPYTELRRHRGPTDPIRITLLEKRGSHTGHNNLVSNWPDIVSSVSAMAGADRAAPSQVKILVQNVDPSVLSFTEQVRLMHNTDVSVSLWGGVTAMNFLLPPNSVQVIISNWWPIGAEPRGNEAKECMDYESDWRGGVGLYGPKALLFCVRSPKRNMNGKTFPAPVDAESLSKLVRRAVRYVHHKRLRDVRAGPPRGSLSNTKAT